MNAALAAGQNKRAEKAIKSVLNMTAAHHFFFTFFFFQMENLSAIHAWFAVLDIHTRK